MVVNLRAHQTFLKNNSDEIFKKTNSLLLFHGTGTGKTCSSLATILPMFGKKTMVYILGSKIVQNQFRDEITGKNGNCNLFNVQSRKRFKYSGYEQFFNLYHLDKNYSKFDNSIFIIDEVQNIKVDIKQKTTSKKYYTLLENIFKNSKNIKLLMLSATPMTNSAEEIYSIVRLMYAINKRKKLTQQEIEKTNVSREQFLKDFTKGKISYIRGNVSGDEKFPDFKIKKIFCDLTKEQRKNYNELEETRKKGKNFSLENFVLFSEKAKNIKLDDLKKKNIGKYSCKYKNLLDNLDNNKDFPIIIHCFAVRYPGISLLKKILKINNHEFTALDGYVTNKQKVVNDFNNGKIKILLGSDVISEGIDFKNVRQLHILQPYWNMARIDQIIGRAIRYNSHSSLSKDEQNVDIYQYITKNTIDSKKINDSMEKDKQIKKYERILKKNAIDCGVMKKYNTLPNDKFKDTRQCDYDDCNYECSVKPINQKAKFKTVLRTFNEYKGTLNEILGLYDTKLLWTMDEILKEVDRDIQYIYLVIHDLLVTFSEENVMVNNNRKGFLIQRGDYYLFRPQKEQGIDEELNYFSLYGINNKRNQNWLEKEKENDDDEDKDKDKDKDEDKEDLVVTYEDGIEPYSNVIPKDCGSDKYHGCVNNGKLNIIQPWTARKTKIGNIDKKSVIQKGTDCINSSGKYSMKKLIEILIDISGEGDVESLKRKLKSKPAVCGEIQKAMREKNRIYKNCPTMDQKNSLINKLQSKCKK